MKHAVGDNARNTRSSSLALPILGVAIANRSHDDNGCHGSFRLQRFRAAAVDFPVLVHRIAPFRSFGSVDSNAIVRSNYAARGPSHPSPRATKRRSLRFLMLNSARRPGIVRLHFRPRRFCRRCASDASYESVGNAGSVDETTADISLVTDSVKRCKG